MSTWQPKMCGVYVSQDRRRRWSTASFNRQLDASGEPQQVVCVEPQAGHRSKLGELHPYVIEEVQDVIYGEGR